jgi:DNA-binding CsgD family transcriptional regulator
MLLGRAAEQRRLDQMLDEARGGHSSVLVLRGEPGIGKTALLAYAKQRATDMTVLRCGGVEAEQMLAFAGLHQLLRPCLGLLDRLPLPQAAALRGAFGLSVDRVDNPFFVSLGLLTLLGEACEERPLLCLIDDLQWLDPASQGALVFAARRLEAERIAVLAAARAGEATEFDAARLPELALRGLEDEPARALLERQVGRAAAADVVQMLLAAARGNPLALLELPAGLSDRQLEGAEPILGPLAGGGAMEQAFRERIARLPAGVRRALLLAAADERGDRTTIERAFESWGLSVSDLEAAAAAGLVELNGAIAFRHPLVRSAAYRSATLAERRAAHEALAAVLDDPVSRAWHRALVTDGPDEAVAAELEAAGEQSAARGAQATATAAFERAAELSEDEARCGHRLRRAAQTALDAGRLQAALGLVERARPVAVDPVDAAELEGLLATVSFRRGSPPETFELLRKLATMLAEPAPDLALQMVMYMICAAAQGGWAAMGVLEAAPTFEQIGGRGERTQLLRALIDGTSSLMQGDAAGAGRRLRAAVERVERVGGDPLTRFIAASICDWTGDYPRARDLLRLAIAELRASGSLALLGGMLWVLAIYETCVGSFRGGPAMLAEALELTRQLGYDNDETACLGVQAWFAALKGNEQECRECAAAAIRRGLVNGIGTAIHHARFGLGLLELGVGNPQEALDQLDQLTPGPYPPTNLLVTPEVIDAALRLGQPQRAAAALERFAAWAPISDAPLVHGMLARCRAILSDDAAKAERLFREALDHHGRGISPYEYARTQLAYGEHLRRQRRRREARIQLRAALDAFEGLGTTIWAERTRGELRATGETARKRDATALDQLTPQELRVARLVAAGASNRDVAAQLFLSPRTVEYHLAKVFSKLGVGSRVELARVPIDPVAPEPAAAGHRQRHE